MLFPTVTFALFFLVVLPLSWMFMPNPTRWRLFIVVASYFFYGWWDWRFIFLLAGSTLFNQMLAHAIFKARDKGRRKLLLIVAVAGNLAVLGYFKYFNFFVESATGLLDALGLGSASAVATIVLPVGISFYTFMALAYVIDVYRGDTEPTTLPKFAVYLSFFPHLVAGPIVRPNEFIPQLAKPRDPRRVDTSRAFFLVAGGLFLKVVIATTVAPLVDQVFATPGQASAIATWVSIYAYAVQIFADFAGYTFMAIGLALLLGFKFPDNFDNPYTATSLRDFWRRWHMTLSRWLRDYLYIPLGGNRKGQERTYVNLMLTMLLGGLWHGAAWTFVIWGGIHGAGLVVEHYRADRRKRLGLPEPEDTPKRRWTRRLITFHIVCLAWVFFRATSFGNAFEVLGRLFAGWGTPTTGITFGILLAIAVGILVQYVPRQTASRVMVGFSRLPIAAQGALLGLVLMVISALGPRGIAPYIYFQF
jgi:alginate O-acetyltransferase complex protein AlgI